MKALWIGGKWEGDEAEGMVSVSLSVLVYAWTPVSILSHQNRRHKNSRFQMLHLKMAMYEREG